MTWGCVGVAFGLIHLYNLPVVSPMTVRENLCNPHADLNCLMLFYDLDDGWKDVSSDAQLLLLYIGYAIGLGLPARRYSQLLFQLCKLFELCLEILDIVPKLNNPIQHPMRKKNFQIVARKDTSLQ